jgi:hypothetical protein
MKDELQIVGQRRPSRQRKPARKLGNPRNIATAGVLSRAAQIAAAGRFAAALAPVVEAIRSAGARSIEQRVALTLARFKRWQIWSRALELDGSVAAEPISNSTLCRRAGFLAPQLLRDSSVYCHLDVTPRGLKDENRQEKSCTGTSHCR